MSLKKQAVQIGGLALLSAGVYYGSGWIRLQTTLASDRTPYTVVYEETGYALNPDGSQKEGPPLGQGAYLKARTSDGSLVNITFDPVEWNHKRMVPQVREIVSMADSTRVFIYEAVRAKSTTRMQPKELAAAKALPSDVSCTAELKDVVIKTEILGREQLLGLEVVRRRFPSDGSSAETEMWEAPALDCAVVYMKTMFRNKNGVFSDMSVRTAIKIDRSEPDTALFALGSLREMKPSDGMLAFMNRTAQPPLDKLPQPLATKMTVQDAAYDARRP